MSDEPAFIVRAAMRADYLAASRLLDTLDHVHREGLPWMFRVPSEPPRPEPSFAALVEGKDSAVFVADAGGLVGISVGLLRDSPTFPVYRPQRFGVLDMLVVDAAWRRRGVGGMLAKAVETWLLDSGAAWVELHVYDFNAEARAFYEKLGYLPLSRKLMKRGR